MSLARLLLRQARQRPDSPALLDGNALQQTQMQGDTQRGIAAMREAGGTSRVAMREQGVSAHASVRNVTDRQRAGNEGRKLDSDAEARGFQIREAGQTEKLHGVLLDPKATAAEKAQAQAALLAIKGKPADHRFTVLPGGQEWDTTANAMRNVPARVLNNQTGQFVEQGGSTQAAMGSRKAPFTQTLKAEAGAGMAANGWQFESYWTPDL